MRDQLYFFMKAEACFRLKLKNKAKPRAVALGQLFLTWVFPIRLATRAKRGWQPGPFQNISQGSPPEQSEGGNPAPIFRLSLSWFAIRTPYELHADTPFLPPFRHAQTEYLYHI